MATYKIIRFFKNDRVRKIVKKGLSLAQAQAICGDPETSRASAKDLEMPSTWFEGYSQE